MEVSGCSFSMFFLSLSFPDFSQEVKCQKYPETPSLTRQHPLGQRSPAGVLPHPPELGAFKSFTDLCHPETTPRRCVTFESRSVAESLGRQSSRAQPRCSAAAAAGTARAAGAPFPSGAGDGGAAAAVPAPGSAGARCCSCLWG